MLWSFSYLILSLAIQMQIERRDVEMRRVQMDGSFVKYSEVGSMQRITEWRRLNAVTDGVTLLTIIAAIAVATWLLSRGG